MNLNTEKTGVVSLKIFNTDQIGMPPGDQGEKWVVFIVTKNLIDSAWAYKQTREKAEELLEIINQLMNA